MKIVVSIDRLVLDGVGQRDVARLQAALEQELTVALAAERAPPGGRGDPRSEADAPIDTSRGPEAIGQAIGQAIARAAHARIVAARAAPPALVSAPPAAAPAQPVNTEARP